MYGSHHNSNAFGFESGSADTAYSILEADFCMDPNIEVDDLRHKLITLNGQLGRIDGRFDYSGIIRTFNDAPPGWRIDSKLDYSRIISKDAKDAKTG